MAGMPPGWQENEDDTAKRELDFRRACARARNQGYKPGDPGAPPFLGFDSLEQYESWRDEVGYR